MDKFTVLQVHGYVMLRCSMRFVSHTQLVDSVT